MSVSPVQLSFFLQLLDFSKSFKYDTEKYDLKRKSYSAIYPNKLFFNQLKLKIAQFPDEFETF